MSELQPEWKKPTSAYRALTEDGYLVVHTIGLGLKIKGKHADFKRAKEDYENRKFGWWHIGGSEQYENAMNGYVAIAREFHENGCQRSWNKNISGRFKDFWYWVATRQQYEEV